jgi:hypothetical protein
MTSILALLIITTVSGTEHAHLMLSHQCRQDIILLNNIAREIEPDDAFLDVDGEKIISMECRPYRMGAVS